MRLSWGSLASCASCALCALCSTLFACTSSLQTYGPPGECPADAGNCGTIVGGANAGSGSTGTSGGDAGGLTTDFTGTVHIILSPAFDDLAQKVFTGTSTITAQGPGGAALTAMYPGSNGPTFDIPGALTGTNWVMVRDGTNGGAGILSTLSPVDLPSALPVALPVIELANLQSIANALPSVAQNGVSQVASQVVLIIYKNNGPAKGVTVSSGANGAQVVYDTGPGNYSDTATMTGTAGTVILFNSGINGPHTITLTDTATMMPYDVYVQAAPGMATLAGFQF